MWVVIYGRHFVYLKYKEYRYETPFFVAALLVYWWWCIRYSMSMYPIKYVKMYKSGEVVQIKTYSASFQGRKRGSI